MPKHARSSRRRAFLFLNEIAILFRVAESTPRYWVHMGILRSSRIGRRAAVPRSDVAALLEQRGLGIAEHEIDSVIDSHREIDTATAPEMPTAA